MQQRLLTLTQVRARFPVAPSRIYELLSAGLFPTPLKVGRRSLWVEADIDAWISSLAEKRDLVDHLGKPLPVLPVTKRDGSKAQTAPHRRNPPRDVTAKEIGKVRASARSG